ncbi:unnamed protein product [Albugo candida]|uniref:Peptidase A1 domain-containing protein n=1 Tax=Albugo candida TaxID=65357 RepID=A0A024GU24_9STRA|nr:unnamed protein product [Albugo candida]|eukprot:CCI49855.1 unnamed protein product [Albugo candida]
MDRECTRKQLINLDVYCTAWKKTWESLKESIEWKELYVYPETSINPEVYFSENVGAYTLIGNFYDGPDLYFGTLPIEELGSYSQALTTGSLWLLMDIEFLQHYYHNQKVTFQFGNGATQVPPEIFGEIGNNKDLGLRLTEDGHYEGNCLQLDAIMAKHSTSRHPLDLKIKHGEKTLVRLLAHQSFISQNNRCGFLIENSTRTGEWVMGSSLLKAYTTIVNTRNQILWITFCPK